MLAESQQKGKTMTEDIKALMEITEALLVVSRREVLEPLEREWKQLSSALLAANGGEALSFQWKGKTYHLTPKS